MIEELAARLAAARSAFVLTGAGMSAESGLPTFRGTNGLWQSHRVEELASPEGFARDPSLVWTWYNQRNAAHRRAQPNAGHYALARIEACVAGFTLATQNVDSLHVRAGSSDPIELHGSLREARCTGCGARRTLGESGLPLEDIRHSCGGLWRPGVVWFGEPLPHDAWARASAAAAQAEVVLVVGTSAVVYPAAALATARAGTYLVEINPETTAISQRADLRLQGAAAEQLSRLAAALGCG